MKVVQKPVRNDLYERYLQENKEDDSIQKQFAKDKKKKVTLGDIYAHMKQQKGFYSKVYTKL